MSLFRKVVDPDAPGSPSKPFASTAVPASGNYVGERIAVANPAILPRGWGWLEWSGAIWFVPAGEPIAQQWGMNNSYLGDVTPGSLTQTQIYASPIIPDVFLPIKQKLELSLFAIAINAAGVSGCRMGAVIAGGVPTPSLATADYQYMAGTSFTPTSSGSGFAEQNLRYPGGRASNGSLSHSKGGTGKLLRNGPTPDFVAGSNRFYLMGLPSHVADRFVFEGGYSIISLGVAS